MKRKINNEDENEKNKKIKLNEREFIYPSYLQELIIDEDNFAKNSKIIENYYFNKFFDINKVHQELTLFFGEYSSTLEEGYGFKNSKYGYDRIFFDSDEEKTYGESIQLTCLQFSIFTNCRNMVQLFIKNGANPFIEVFFFYLIHLGCVWQKYI
jgi:hypothetical protein